VVRPTLRAGGRGVGGEGQPLAALALRKMPRAPPIDGAKRHLLNFVVPLGTLIPCQHPVTPFFAIHSSREACVCLRIITWGNNLVIRQTAHLFLVQMHYRDALQGFGHVLSRSTSYGILASAWAFRGVSCYRAAATASRSFSARAVASGLKLPCLFSAPSGYRTRDLFLGSRAAKQDNAGSAEA
jgi:hypothetical protein